MHRLFCYGPSQNLHVAPKVSLSSSIDLIYLPINYCVQSLSSVIGVHLNYFKYRSHLLHGPLLMPVPQVQLVVPQPARVCLCVRA